MSESQETDGYRIGVLVDGNIDAGPQTDGQGGRRSYECAQIVGPGSEGDVVPTGNFQFQRHWAGEPADWASFKTLRCPHAAGIRFFKLDSKMFTFSVKKGFFRTPGLPARIEIKIPSVCVVAAVAGVANNFGYGPFTTFPLSHHSEPFMPGDRTCNGGAYTFQIPGALAVAETVAIPMRVQDSASIRCIYEYVQTAGASRSCRRRRANRRAQIPGRRGGGPRRAGRKLRAPLRRRNDVEGKLTEAGYAPSPAGF
ncbi:MAG: hypothetical protein EXQ52_00690 [Bryobacterales bacterium]|nr:hypothetical protein [Bryobacterales bacterium]